MNPTETKGKKTIVLNKEQARRLFPKIDFELLCDYRYARKRLITSLVSKERFADRLDRVPFMEVDDMALVFRIILDNSEGTLKTTLITNDLMEQFGIDLTTLYLDAQKSAESINPPVVRNLAEIIFEMGRGQAPYTQGDETMLYFVGTEQKTLGASALFYPGMLQKIARFLGGNYYILPSSIHEMLVVRDNGELDPAVLSEMIQEINETIVHPSERLTDHAYYYDCDRKEFRSA